MSHSSPGVIGGQREQARACQSSCGLGSELAHDHFYFVLTAESSHSHTPKSRDSAVCLAHSWTSLGHYMIKAVDIGGSKKLGPRIQATAGVRKVKRLTLWWYFKSVNNYKTLYLPIQLGAINVTYSTVPGMLSLKNETEGNLAEPDVDFVSVVGFLILEEGETTAAINITILEVKLFTLLLLYLI